MKDVLSIRYSETKSVIHTLDARVKLLFLLVYIASLFYSSSFSTLLFSFIVLASIFVISRVPVSVITRGMGRLIMIYLVLGIITALTAPGGIRAAGVMLIRLFLSVLSSNLLTSTTTSRSIAKAVDKALGKGPFKRGAHILSTIVLVAFRFIPILQSEAKRIMDAQTSRGCSFDDGTVIERAEKSLSLIIPLFVSAFRRADELALSMDSRLYNRSGSSSMYPLKYRRRDIFSILLILLYLVLSFVIERTLWI